MKKIRIGMEIIFFLAGQKSPQNAENITKHLNNTYETPTLIKKRTVLEYLREISHEFSYVNGGVPVQTIKSIKGRDGGWIITESGRNNIKELSVVAFNIDTLNAINDSLERAMISETFYYKDDLKQAKGILYSKRNFFNSDHEHYLGNGEEIIKSSMIKKIKQAANNEHYSIFTFKHIRYQITSKEMTLKPIRLIHDLDESFLVCTQKNSFEPMYINIRNIINIKETNNRFFLKQEQTFHQNLNSNRSSIAPRTQQWATIKVTDPMVYQVVDLWVHGCKFNVNKKDKTISITSNEHYRLMNFLFRTIGLATIIDAHPMVIQRWNQNVDNIKKIK